MRLSGGQSPPERILSRHAPLFGPDKIRVLWWNHSTPPTAPEERRRPHFVGPLSGGHAPPERILSRHAPLFGPDKIRVLWWNHSTPPTAPEERRRPHFVGPLSGGHAPPERILSRHAPLFGLDKIRVLWWHHSTPPTAPEERRRPHFVGPLCEDRGPKLTTGSVLITAAGVAEGDVQALSSHLPQEPADRATIGLAIWRPLHRIEGDQVDVCQPAPEQRTHLVRVALRGVDTSQQHPLIPDAPASLAAESIGGRDQLGERVTSVYRHKDVAQLIPGRVQGDGEGERHSLPCQPVYPRRQT